MNSCLTCGGLIMEPNTSYGYAGKTCHCIVPPKIQRPMSVKDYVYEPITLSQADEKVEGVREVPMVRDLIEALEFYADDKHIREHVNGQTVMLGAEECKPKNTALLALEKIRGLK